MGSELLTTPRGSLNQPVEAELSRTLDQLARLRDEIRLQIHLGGMDMAREFILAEDELEAVALSAAAATEAQRVGALERLRAVAEITTQVARTIPGAP